MKNQYSRIENNCPKAPEKLRIPDQIDLYMEDGTIYHVRSFFAGELLMGDVLDATMEQVLRGAKQARPPAGSRCQGHRPPPLFHSAAGGVVTHIWDSST